MLEYLGHLVAVSCLYATFAIALDMVVGEIGGLSLTTAAFAGIGAYTGVLLAPVLGFQLSLCLCAAAAAGAFSGFVVAVITKSMREESFAVASLGMQLIITESMNNLVSVTNGPMGIGNIQRPRFFGASLESQPGIVVVIVVILGLAAIFRKFVARGIWKAVYSAMRSNEVFSISCGIPVKNIRLLLFAASSSLIAVAGMMLAFFVGYVDPGSFGISNSMLILSMLVIGGIGSIRGPIAGAMLLILLPEALTFVGIPAGLAANIRQIMYGLILVAIVLWRPQGLFGHKETVRHI